jgi:hypothetical protein
MDDVERSLLLQQNLINSYVEKTKRAMSQARKNLCTLCLRFAAIVIAPGDLAEPLGPHFAHRLTGKLSSFRQSRRAFRLTSQTR